MYRYAILYMSPRYNPATTMVVNLLLYDKTHCHQQLLIQYPYFRGSYSEWSNMNNRIIINNKSNTCTMHLIAHWRSLVALELDKGKSVLMIALTILVIKSEYSEGTRSKSWPLDIESLKGRRLKNVKIPIINLKRSDGRFRFTMGILIATTRRFRNEVASNHTEHVI